MTLRTFGDPGTCKLAECIPAKGVRFQCEPSRHHVCKTLIRSFRLVATRACAPQPKDCGEMLIKGKRRFVLVAAASA